MKRLTTTVFAIGFGVVVWGCAAPESYDSNRRQIVGGSNDTGHPAVAYLSLQFSDGSYGCSGTLISPRVVLTAAHCVDESGESPSSITAYFGSDATTSDPYRIESIPGIDSTFKAGWSIGNYGHNDIALVLLQYEASTPPMSFNTQSPANLIGQNLTIVGWGQTYSGTGTNGSGVKRAVTTPMADYNSTLLFWGTSNKNTCQGDSGGPGFMNVGGTQKVVSITSWGQTGCTGLSGGTRVDVYSSWIQDYINTNDASSPPQVDIVKPANGATVGSYFVVQVSATDNVAVEHVELRVNGTMVGSVSSQPYVFNVSGLSEGPVTIEATAFDSRGESSKATTNVTVGPVCQSAADCADGQECVAGSCKQPGGGLGDSCAANEDCTSGMCGQDGDDQYCSQLCDINSNDCPEGFDCVGIGGGRGACIKGSGSAGGPANGGGCGIHGGAGGGWPSVLLLLGLCAWLLRRRRHTRMRRFM